MCDEKKILQSMALFPTVLELIIIDYITRKEITFVPYNNNKAITISEDGRTLSNKPMNSLFYASVSPIPFRLCRLRWKIEMLSEQFHGYLGIAFPDRGSLGNDIRAQDCIYIFCWTDLSRKLIAINGHEYFCPKRSFIMEVDLIQSTLFLCLDENDQIISNSDDTRIIGNVPIATGIKNLEQCFPFISLQSGALTVTSY